MMLFVDYKETEALSCFDKASVDSFRSVYFTKLARRR